MRILHRFTYKQALYLFYVCLWLFVASLTSLVVISFMESTCSCTSTSLPVSVINPYERIPLTCLMNTSGRSSLTGGMIIIAYKPENHKQDERPYFAPIQLRANVVTAIDNQQP